MDALARDLDSSGRAYPSDGTAATIFAGNSPQGLIPWQPENVAPYANPALMLATGPSDAPRTSLGALLVEPANAARRNTAVTAARPGGGTGCFRPRRGRVVKAN
jgi:hypothetical protein